MRRPLPALVFSAALAMFAVLAFARPAAAGCNTDLDCPGATCGSPVCQGTVSGGNCVAAGTDVEGFDGECSADSDCKCAGQGATCSAEVFHCTFTLPSQAPVQPDGGIAGEDAGGDADNSAGCRIAKGPTDSITIFAAGVAAVVLARRGKRSSRRPSRRRP